MKAKMKLTEKQVLQFLKDHTDDKITDVQSLTGGMWSKAFAFSRSGENYVVRFGKYDEDYLKDKKASVFSRKNLPTVRVLEVGSAFDGYFAISQQAFGEMLDELDAGSMQKTIPAVMRMLNALREIDVSAAQGYGLWGRDDNATYSSWKEYLLKVEYDDPKHRTHGWKHKLANSPIGDKAFYGSFQRLKELISICPEEKHIVHSDLLNRNVLVEGHEISAVIDWGCSVYGDFLYDLAWFSYWTSWYPNMKRIDWEAEAEKYFSSIGVTIPNFKERLLCYKIHIGLNAQSGNAYTGRWDELKRNTEQTLELVS